MLKKVLLKMKLPDEDLLHSLVKILYLNVFTVSRFYIFAFDLENAEIGNFKGAADSEDLIFTVLPGSQVAKHLPQASDLPREFHIHEIDKVKECVAVLNDGVIVHIFWLYKHDNPSRCFKLKRDEACINYAYTLPSFRGSGLYPRAIIFAARYLRAQGYKRILTVAHKGTINTLASYEKIPGLEKVAELRHWFFLRPKYRS